MELCDFCAMRNFGLPRIGAAAARLIAGGALTAVRHLGLVAFLTVALTCAASAQTQPVIAEQKTEGPQFSPEANQVAAEIGVAPLLERLHHFPQAQPAGDPATKIESLILRQEITEKVLSTSLEIDSVNAVIDVEIEQIRSIRSGLQARRDKTQNIINLASIVTGGAFGAITSAMQFKPSTVNLGNGIGVAGGVGSVLLSIVGIRKQGGRRTLGDSPRMLARFFGRKPDAVEAIPSVYPEAVWSYLNSPTQSGPNLGTRREQLIAKWRSEGRLEPDASPKAKGRIETASDSLSQVRKLSIGNLDDRIAMLLDVRARVSLMKRGLIEILRGLSAARNPQ
jgi:hypothetical protein